MHALSNSTASVPCIGISAMDCDRVETRASTRMLCMNYTVILSEYQRGRTYTRLLELPGVFCASINLNLSYFATRCFSEGAKLEKNATKEISGTN